MRACILGGGGSFGLHTANYLLKHDVGRVISIGRNPPKPRCFTLGVGDGDKRYTYRPFHITYEHDLLMEYLDREKPDVIINFAAQGESAASLHHSWRYYETNCVGLARLVEALQTRPWLRRFVHIGTSELYGATEVPATEDALLRPTSPYAVSKAAFDLHLMAIAKYGFPMNIIRPSNAYGQGQQLHRIIPKAVVYGLSNRKLPLHGGGKAEKSYLHSQDLARAIYLVAEGGKLGEVYNVGPEQPTAICDVVRMVADALGKDFEDLCEITSDREHQDARYWLDSKKIRQELCWKPLIDWDHGLTDMVLWVWDFPELLNMPTEFTMRA